MNLHIRPLEHKDIALISDYWINSPDQHLLNMGVDLEKLPSESDFEAMLTHQLSLEDKDKQSYALIWEVEGRPIGHSNVNKITFGEEAYMHLHIWKKEDRALGYGKALIELSLKQFFEALKLKRIICEPYALNKAPNKTLKRVGFEFKTLYRTIPGSINFEQEVNHWVLTKEKYIEFVHKKSLR